MSRGKIAASLIGTAGKRFRKSLSLLKCSLKRYQTIRVGACAIASIISPLDFKD